MDIKQELGPQLSREAALLLPEDADFASTGQRWNRRFPVNFSAIVDAASEEDVAAAVKYANVNNVPFLAFNGTHGAQLPLLKFKNGIGITTLKMKSLTVNDDGTATLKGSWLSGHLRDELYKVGKRTTLGSCDSTGIIGPMLGGGHGFLQGRYGLLADQIVELRVVLADGSIITVREDSHKELFWAMRGAGHNFGVVTELKYKIYDVPKEDVWTQSEMVFKGEKLEEVAKVFNELQKQQPVNLAIWFPQIMRMPDIDAVNVSTYPVLIASSYSTVLKPVINIQFLYEGPATNNPFLAPLEALGPVLFSSKVVPWTQASDAIGWGWSSFSNKKGLMSILRFPIGLKTFSYGAMRAVYDRFSAVTAANPAFGYSFVVWESYATHGVKAVADEATAVADRSDEMLVAPMIIYPPDVGLDEEAERFGKELRSLLLEGREELHAYVNYAHGDESLEEVYGHQGWRLDRLRKLKKQYDPENRFGFYSPIV
jgi:FAD/FMN-containing dehydrogenase